MKLIRQIFIKVCGFLLACQLAQLGLASPIQADVVVASAEDGYDGLLEVNTMSLSVGTLATVSGWVEPDDGDGGKFVWDGSHWLAQSAQNPTLRVDLTVAQNHLTFFPSLNYRLESSSDLFFWRETEPSLLTSNPDGTLTAVLPQGGKKSYYYRIVSASSVNTEAVIFLVEGQSNSVGPSHRADSEPILPMPLANMFMMSRGFSHPTYNYAPGERYDLIPMNPTMQDARGTGITSECWAFHFACLYAAENPGKDIMILHNGYGGSSFNQAPIRWGVGKLLTVGGERDFKMLRNILKDKYTSVSMGGLLWHQGESDADYSEAVPEYQNQLTTHFTVSRREAFEEGQFPIVVGTLADDFVRGRADNDNVDEVIRAIPTLIENAGLADLSGIPTVDQVHFDVEFTKTIAQRYYEIYQSLEIVSD